MRNLELIEERLKMEEETSFSRYNDAMIEDIKLSVTWTLICIADMRNREFRNSTFVAYCISRKNN